MKNFSIEGLLVQPNLNRVSLGDQEWRLEPKIMNVLVVLAQNKGKVVSKEELLKEVWQGTIVVDMVVARAISELRNIFKQGLDGTKVIETIPKKGYRIVANVNFNDKRSIPKLKPLIFLLFALMVLGYFGYRYGILEKDSIDTESNLTIKPFTSYRGWEYDPKISSDGKFVAFIFAIFSSNNSIVTGMSSFNSSNFLATIGK